MWILDCTIHEPQSQSQTEEFLTSAVVLMMSLHSLGYLVIGTVDMLSLPKVVFFCVQITFG